jgi:hypothetical protein
LKDAGLWGPTAYNQRHHITYVACVLTVYSSRGAGPRHYYDLANLIESDKQVH